MTMTPREAGIQAFYADEGTTNTLQGLNAAFDAYEAASPDFYAAASKLLAAFDELQSATTAERIITGRSYAELRRDSNEAIAELRAAIAKVEA